MSISSEISRISGNVSDALEAIENKGVAVPSDANSDDLAELINQIPTSTGGVLIVDTPDSHGGVIREITTVEIDGSLIITQNGVYDVTNLRRIIVKVAGSSSIDEENPIIGTGALGLATIGSTDPAGANSITGIGLTGEAIVGAGPAGQATVGSGTADQAIAG